MDDKAAHGGAFSIVSFCAAHDIGRTAYFYLRRKGLGPREFQVGRRILISTEAAAEWRAAREAATPQIRVVRPGRAR